MESREQKAWFLLGEAWARVHMAAKLLGEGHPESKGLDETMGRINHMECSLHKYLEKEGEKDG